MRLGHYGALVSPLRRDAPPEWQFLGCVCALCEVFSLCCVQLEFVLCALCEVLVSVLCRLFCVQALVGIMYSLLTATYEL